MAEADTSLLSRVQELHADREPITPVCPEPKLSMCPERATPNDGDGLQLMSDEEREQAIDRAGKAMLAWYSHYRETGNTKALDMAYAAMGMQRRLIAGRR